MLIPNWPAPKNINALTFTRSDSITSLPSEVELHLLNQVHGSNIVSLPNAAKHPKGDGVYTANQNIACGIKTADCLAILLCNQAGTEIAAVHGGWRGLAAGVIASCLQKFQTLNAQIMAWLSPAICPEHYEVDKVVYEAFVKGNALFETCFTQNRPGHWHCDLSQIARLQLEHLDVKAIFCSDQCTFEDREELYSYRRDPKEEGRLIHTIWMSSLGMD